MPRLIRPKPGQEYSTIEEWQLLSTAAQPDAQREILPGCRATNRTAYLVVVDVPIFGRLLVFLPLLVQARREALRSYGMLVQQHHRLFHEKWIAGQPVRAESPLGNPDMSSLVGLGPSYRSLTKYLVPVRRRQMLQGAAVTCLLGVPLPFPALPILEVARLIFGVVS